MSSWIPILFNGWNYLSLICLNDQCLRFCQGKSLLADSCVLKACPHYSWSTSLLPGETGHSGSCDAFIARTRPICGTFRSSMVFRNQGLAALCALRKDAVVTWTLLFPLPSQRRKQGNICKYVDTRGHTFTHIYIYTYFYI